MKLAYDGEKHTSAGVRTKLKMSSVDTLQVPVKTISLKTQRKYIYLNVYEPQ